MAHLESEVYLMLELCEQGDLLRRLGAEPSHCLPEDDVAVIAEALELR